MEKLAISGRKKTVTVNLKDVNNWPLFAAPEFKDYFKVKYALSCVR